MLVDAKRRVKFIDKLFDARGQLFLDVGCTDARVVLALKRNKDFFVGIDIDIRALNTAKNTGIKAVAASAEHLPFKEGAFDGIICSEVLEHLADDRGAIKEIARVLKKSGLLVISVPNSEIEKILPFKALVKNYYQRLESAVSHVRKGYTLCELKALCEAESLRLREFDYDLKIIGAIFHLTLYYLYSHQEDKFRRFVLRTYLRLLRILAPLYSFDDVLKRKGLQIFASFIKAS